jgi:hypothetical protein
LSSLKAQGESTQIFLICKIDVMEIEVLEQSTENWVMDNPEVQLYTFKLTNFYSLEVVMPTPYEEAHTAKNIDPAKVLLWILKKIKEALCPECM